MCAKPLQDVRLRGVLRDVLYDIGQNGLRPGGPGRSLRSSASPSRRSAHSCPERPQARSALRADRPAQEESGPQQQAKPADGDEAAGGSRARGAGRSG
eukprot:9227574-Pyramimonas_sp.AAC.1